MKKIEITAAFREFASIEELEDGEKKLMMEARKAAQDAYAPYSQYRVGAALLLENGIVIRGNNQENAAYPSGLCAERVAIFYAGANHPDVPVKAIAITALSDNHKIDYAVGPCGACRQAIAEYEYRFNHEIKILMMGEEGNVLVAESIKSLLPLTFNPDDLNKKPK